ERVDPGDADVRIDQWLESTHRMPMLLVTTRSHLPREERLPASVTVLNADALMKTWNASGDREILDEQRRSA
ncbi:MAG: hypothetical protein AAGA03_12655, partial [Planctomycetota bacterium]